MAGNSNVVEITKETLNYKETPPLCEEMPAAAEVLFYEIAIALGVM